jgi:hypothetical protein
MFPQQEHLPSSDGTRVLIPALYAQQIGGSGLTSPSGTQIEMVTKMVSGEVFGVPVS